VSGVGRGMGVLDGGDDRRRGRGSFGVNLGRPIVTNGAFATTRLFSNYFEDLFPFLYYSFLQYDWAIMSVVGVDKQVVVRI